MSGPIAPDSEWIAVDQLGAVAYLVILAIIVVVSTTTKLWRRWAAHRRDLKEFERLMREE